MFDRDLCESKTIPHAHSRITAMISFENVANCRNPTAGVFTRGSSFNVSGCVYSCPFTVNRTVYRPGAAHGVFGIEYVRCGTAPVAPPSPPGPPSPGIGS